MENPKDRRAKVHVDNDTLQRLRVLSALQDRPMTGVLRGVIADAFDRAVAPTTTPNEETR